jgi:hypothetical protein
MAGTKLAKFAYRNRRPAQAKGGHCNAMARSFGVVGKFIIIIFSHEKRASGNF